jgi:hypothetical protein
MFGLPEALMSFIRRQVGLRTDAAAASGSLHAKVKDIADNVLPTLQKPRGPAGVAGVLMTDTGSLVTALDITGRGRLVGLMLNQTSVTNPSVVVTVDGYAVASGASQLGAGGVSYPDKSYYVYGGSFSADGQPRNAEINFVSSLKIQINSGGAGQQGTIRWFYELE